jgi:hypothetical protein
LEAINSGVGGWSTVQEFLYLRDEGLGFEPHLVVSMFFDNDIEENCLSYDPGVGARPHATLTPDGAAALHEEFTEDEFLRFCLPVPFRGLAHRYSYLYLVLNERVYHRLNAENLLQLQRQDRARLDPDTGLRLYLALLDRMSALLTPRHVNLLVVLAPRQQDVTLGTSPLHDAIQAACKARGIDCLPLLPAMQEAVTKGKRPYFEHDIHWTRDGHQVVARVLGALLAEHKLGKESR